MDLRLSPRISEARKRAVVLVNMHASEGVSVQIVPDSQSLWRAICDKNENPDEIHLMLDECKQRLTIRWIPDHAGIEGNRRAGRPARQAANLTDTRSSIAPGGAKSVIKRTIKEKQPV